MSSEIRQQRLASLLFEELSIMIPSELDDPRMSMVSVTAVVVSKDLRNVKVFVSHMDDEVPKQEVITRLRRATPYLRSQIAVRCTLRVVPDLTFHYDDSPERANRLSQVFRQIADERSQRAPESPTDEAAA